MDEQHGITVTVSCQELLDLAFCSCRMTDYADPEGKRLITILQSADGTQINLVLDKRCIIERRFEVKQLSHKNFQEVKTMKKKIVNLKALALNELMEVKAVLRDKRGEDQNTAVAGGVIFALLLAAIVIGFGTGYIQNSFLPKAQQAFDNLWNL